MQRVLVCSVGYTNCCFLRICEQWTYLALRNLGTLQLAAQMVSALLTLMAELPIECCLGLLLELATLKWCNSPGTPNPA